MEASIVGEVYASQKQQDRSQLSSTPEHLSRVLYIPCHSVTTSYLALYHVSSLWIEATGDGPPVAYTVKFTTGDKDAVVGTVEYHVQPESTGTVHAQVELTVGKGDEKVCSIKVNGDSDSAQPIDPVAVSISYPVSPSETQPGQSSFPTFISDAF
ncbi:hypothetical protein CNMCM5878_010337 [Aspergillus fumigatiaffinis]|nr:hypothetical protein CNMCM5878_010337 [Aspergillus fumigatiaffinis]